MRAREAALGRHVRIDAAYVRERLAGLDGDPPEPQLAELAEHRLHEVMRADRHAAAGDDDVRAGDTVTQSCPDVVEVVEGDPEPDDVGPELSEGQPTEGSGDERRALDDAHPRERCHGASVSEPGVPARSERPVVGERA